MKNNTMENKSTNKRFWIKGVMAAAVLVFMAACNNPADDRGAGAAPNVPEQPAVSGDVISADNPIVATANGRGISAGDVSILITQAEDALAWDYFEMFGTLDLDYSQEFRDGITFGRAVLEEAVRLASFTQLYLEYAEQLGVTLTEEDRAVVANHLEMLVEDFGEEELGNMLRIEGFRNMEHFEGLLDAQLIWNNLITALLDSPEDFARFEPYMRGEQDLAEDLLGAKHILANFDNFGSEEEAEEFANEILARLHAGEDFDELMWEYGQDPGMANFPGGYSFMSGEMVPEFEEATRELEMGEISGLVRSHFGFHIIKRTEPNQDDWHSMQGLPPMTIENRKIEAIFLGFEAMVDRAELVFFPELDDVLAGR